MQYADLQAIKCDDGELITRTSVPEADAILGKAFRVLDKGFVRLIDYMGNDARIVQAARVSYGAGTKSSREDDALIRYLIENQHTSPLEQVILTFHVKLPIFVARQLVRHRTASLNEISGRYSILKDEFYVPEIENVHGQSKTNKQGRNESDDELCEATKQAFIDEYRAQANEQFHLYGQSIDSGISRELARLNLPLSTYTEWYWTMDLNNLLKFLALRMDHHAQWEIREYANVKCELARLVVPSVIRAYEELIFCGARLIDEEKALFKDLILEKISCEGESSLNLDPKRLQKLYAKLGVK